MGSRDVPYERKHVDELSLSSRSQMEKVISVLRIEMVFSIKLTPRV